MIRAVAKETGVSVDDIMGNSRKRHIVVARYAYWYLLFMKKRCTILQISECCKVQYQRVRYGLLMFSDWLDFYHHDAIQIWGLINNIEEQ